MAVGGFRCMSGNPRHHLGKWQATLGDAKTLLTEGLSLRSRVPGPLRIQLGVHIADKIELLLKDGVVADSPEHPGEVVACIRAIVTGHQHGAVGPGGKMAERLIPAAFVRRSGPM